MLRRMHEETQGFILPAVMVAAWLVFLMVAFEYIPQPFEFLRVLMPWTMVFDVPVTYNLAERVGYLQRLLDNSVIVANLGLLLIVGSVAALGISATYTYEQRQRRARENEMLLLKNREIARRNEFIRYISATIGHEFKNNLGRIKRRLDFLQLDNVERERINENLEKLFADIDIFKRISDEREAGLIEFGPVDIREMLEGLVKGHADMVECGIRFDAPRPVIFGSRTLLATVFENLLDNAQKYKEPGSAKARASIAVSIDTDGTRRYVSISLRDEGVGMEEHAADACFYKACTGKSAEGWGEGLYFAKYVVGLHAGKIRVGKEYTAPGVGTEIIIKLPYIEDTPRV